VTEGAILLGGDLFLPGRHGKHRPQGRRGARGEVALKVNQRYKNTTGNKAGAGIITIIITQRVLAYHYCPYGL